MSSACSGFVPPSHSLPRRPTGRLPLAHCAVRCDHDSLEILAGKVHGKLGGSHLLERR